MVKLSLMVLNTLKILDFRVKTNFGIGGRTQKTAKQ